MDIDYIPKRAQNHQPRPSVLKALADAFREMPGEIMLPNLSTLCLEPPDNGDTAGQEMFLCSADVLYGPKLLDFLIATDRAPQDACDVTLVKLAEACPGLLSINIEQTIWHFPLAVSVSRMLCSFNSLEDVHTGSIPISPEAFFHLAKLASLQVLECRMQLNSEDQFLAIFEHAEDKGYFSTLRDIILVHPSSLALPTVMLQAVSSPSLACVTVEVDEGLIRAQEVKDIFTTIASRTGHSHIREVKVGVPMEFQKPGDVFTFDAIEPLLALPELTSVTVGGFEHYAIDDYALLAIATAWPHLHQLSLVPHKLKDPPKPLSTLAGLVAFAQNCPKLCSLGLALDTNPHHLPTYFTDMRPGLGMRQRKLVKLEVGRSPIEDPLAIAAFLSDLFPKLHEIRNGFSPLEDLLYFQGPGDEDERQQIRADAVHAERWAEVEWVYLPRFVQIRKQERKWGRKVGLRPKHPLKVTRVAGRLRMDYA